MTLIITFEMCLIIVHLKKGKMPFLIKYIFYSQNIRWCHYIYLVLNFPSDFPLTKVVLLLSIQVLTLRTQYVSGIHSLFLFQNVMHFWVKQDI